MKLETTPPAGVMNIRPPQTERMPQTFQLLSPREVQDYYQKIIDNWKPISDVWAVRIAPYVMHVGVIGSALYINHLFRARLKLRERGLFISCTAAGAMATSIFGLADGMARKKILENNYCPVCMEVRYALTYVGSGVIYPLLVTPVINFMVADKYGINIPSITKYKEIARFWWSAVQPAKKPLIAITGVYVALGLFLSYCTMDSIHFVHFVLAKMHRDYIKKLEDLEANKLLEENATVSLNG